MRSAELRPDAAEALTGGGQDAGSGTTAELEREERCRSGEDANQCTDCRMIATAQSLDQLWDEDLPQTTGETYVLPDVHLFDDGAKTGCGAASSAVGPFYCPAAVIGDDRIQATMEGRVAFTHGFSAQRQAWFTGGYEVGDIARCDTFTAPDLADPASLTP